VAALGGLGKNTNKGNNKKQSRLGSGGDKKKKRTGPHSITKKGSTITTANSIILRETNSTKKAAIKKWQG